MNILILYDSVFGNTEQIALAMKDSVATPHTAVAVKPDAFSLELLKDLDIFIVGSPTRAFRPTPAITNLLKKLPLDALAQGIHTTAFDTRVSLEDANSKFLNFMVSLFGYAAKPMDALLVRHGGTQLAEPAWFFVEGKEGPLKANEKERAATWIKELIAKLSVLQNSKS